MTLQSGAAPLILAVLQARMSSTRLPGKVMADLVGAPMIARQIERVGRCRLIDRIVLATSIDPSDDPLAECAQALEKRFANRALHLSPSSVGTWS